MFVNYIPYSSVFLGTNFNISIEQTTVVICVWTCDVFLCKKQTKALPSVFVNHIIKMLRIKKKSLIIFVHGVTNVPFGLEDIWVGFMRSRNAWDNEPTRFSVNTCTCIYLGSSMYKHELYYVGHFLHMYDVSDRKTTHMNCKHVYPFPRLVYYRVCFDNILKSDCTDISSGVMNVLVI